MRTDPPASEPQTFIVRAGSGGEALVTSPSGQMEFMGAWKLLKFAFEVFRAGHKIEVQDD